MIRKTKKISSTDEKLPGKTPISIRLPDAWVKRLDRIAAQRQETEPGLKFGRASLAEMFVCTGIEVFEANLQATEILPPSGE